MLLDKLRKDTYYLCPAPSPTAPVRHKFPPKPRFTPQSPSDGRRGRRGELRVEDFKWKISNRWGSRVLEILKIKCRWKTIQGRRTEQLQNLRNNEDREQVAAVIFRF